MKKLTDQNAFLVGILAHDITQKQEELLAGLGLTATGAKVIGFLYSMEGKPVYQVDVQNYMKLKSATVTGVLQNLERDGFLLRQAVAGDKRRKSLVLTDRGQAACDEISHASYLIEEALTLGFSISDKMSFHALLQKAINNMSRRRSFQE